jgi:exopolyphosphatase/guanosine-5'-triphosphate,3'-diphosphate pyrophosphatase
MISRGERIAAIDVGSNTILLTVAEYQAESGLTVVQEGEEQPRLGAGVSVTGLLSEEAMRRALQTLATMKDACRRLGVSRIGAVATAAVREARNGAEFVDRARGLDIPLRIISPEAEASLSYRSAAYRFPGHDRLVVADIGGGSLELIGAAKQTVRFTESLPLGAVRLTELQKPLDLLREHVGQVLSATLESTEWEGSTVIGSGGTFAALASMALARRGAADYTVHGTTVRLGEVEDLLGALDGMSPEQRRRVPGLKPERADIIVAGLAVVAELLRETGSEAVTISSFGLRDGLLLEMAGVV